MVFNTDINLSRFSLVFIKYTALIHFAGFACLLFVGRTMTAQDFKQQLEFVVANDKFTFQDRYYTGGLFISYKKELANNFILNNTDANSLQLQFDLGNETYTPTDLSSFDSSRFDRPFAGWFYGGVSVTQFKKQSSLLLALEAGVTGDESLSGDLQLAFHDLLGLSNRPTWAEQIDFKVLFNLKLKYVKNIQLDAHNVFQLETHPTIGTKDIFFENNFKYIFGKLNVFNESAANGVVNNNFEKEIFGSISLGHKYVVHNTILQGGITRDEITFTASPTRNIFNLKMGGVLKLKRNTFKLYYDFNTRETALSDSHGFGSIVFARSF